MGITGLWKIVEPTSTEIPLECLEGKKLAVDVSIWIYQAQCAYPSDQPYPHLRLLINRLCKLLFYKIRPVFVFDGPNVPELKRQVLESRKLKKIKEDDVITNSKKMNHLKQIASGQLTESELAKSVATVISPTKRVELNDVYKQVPDVEIDLEPSEPQMDQLYHQGGWDSEDEEDVVVIEKEEQIEDSKTSQSRRQKVENLVEQREFMRNSRLCPSMIPADSNDISNFQMQRLLKRGRLNCQIEQLTKNTTILAGGSDKINVVGPDGTQHILKYAHSDQVQVVEPTNKRDIDGIYVSKKQESAIDLSLDIFNVEYGGKMHKSKETTPDEIEPVVHTKDEEVEQEFYSKSGLLEEIVRKRMRKHFQKKDSSSEDEMIDVSDDEQLIKAVIESTKPSEIPSTSRSEPIAEEEWDPQRYDQYEEAPRVDFDDEYIRLDFDEDDKTPQMYKDLQEFLTNCGIPWLEAPGEAEAQCVHLEKLGLVDGVISDDSDVWAFGVRNVYRHMFARKKRVQRYGHGSNSDNAKLFCLQREDYISIALLAGGDYCSGLNKVGAIGALEFIAEYVEKRATSEELNIVENRVMRLLKNVQKILTNTPDEISQIPTNRQILMLRRHVNESNSTEAIESICQNRSAVHSYLFPNVDESSEKFRWRKVNINLIQKIMHQKLHWPEEGRNEEKNSITAFEKWNEFLAAGGRSQMRLDRFFAQPFDSSLILTWSKKVIDAMDKISKRSKGEILPEVEEVPKIKKTPIKKAKTTTKRGGTSRRGRGGRRGGKTSVTCQKELVLSEESSDDSF